ncbi:hypothetical protein B296_00000636 [Ensete ventricosum]|uniref:Uncharacterized protein n=1 Tax=Ensete ventricosum TaxID=4639 RepID=A0A427B4J1_ENSVE|nr:hypothetical protein B296_00000636 [Ensete ventricosum]
MEKMELNVQNGDQEGELGTQVNNYYNYLEQDHAVALWVKSNLHLFHQAVIENARKVTAWKEFAMEASQCRDYADLGRMLLKLQTVNFTDMDWFGRVEVAFENRSCVLYHSLGSLNSSTRPLNG